MKKTIPALVAALALAASGFGQVVITTADMPAVITFDSSVDGATSGQFAGTGFSPTPSSGQLDSDAWAFTGMSDGSVAFGGTATTGDFARGSVAAAQTTGGLFAFGTTDRQLMIQPGATDWTPGTLTLRAVNGLGTDTTSISVSYDLFVRNDQNRSNSFNFSYSLDGGTNFVTTDLSNPLFTYTSVEALDALGWVNVGTASASITLTSAIANGGQVLFRWSGDDVGGADSRDEFGLDNISISMGATAIPEPSTYAVIMGALTLGVVLLRRRQKA
ncbi:MAG TPA: PEP-CTERM sorting domain-containing protein [Opitutaceae bacterium]